MAPVPKKKHTKSRSGKRTAHIKLSPPSLVKCPNCGKLKFPHKVCPHCGKYQSK